MVQKWHMMHKFFKAKLLKRKNQSPNVHSTVLTRSVFNKADPLHKSNFVTLRAAAGHALLPQKQNHLVRGEQGKNARITS